MDAKDSEETITQTIMNEIGKYEEVSVYSIADQCYLDNGVYALDNADLKQVDTILIPCGLHQDGFVVVNNRGDSMEKLIMDGAVIVIDTTSSGIVSGSLYVLNVPWEGCIVRECHSELEGLYLRPYNRNYPPTTISWEDFDPAMVIGKVHCTIYNVFR